MINVNYQHSINCSNFLKTTIIKPTCVFIQNWGWIRSAQFRNLPRMKVSSCYATPSQRILYFSRNPAQGHTTELWGRLLYFSKELTSNKAEQIMKYVTLWISLLPAAKCPGAAHALFNVALQNCCTELYIGVCTWERGVSLLLSQLLGKVPVNIWVLRNISCDGSYQYFGILSGVGRCYQQVECVWASALPCRHTSWKNCFKKLTTKQVSPSWASQVLHETPLLQILCWVVKSMDKSWNECTLLEPGWPWAPAASRPWDVWGFPANSSLGWSELRFQVSIFSFPSQIPAQPLMHSLQQQVKPQVSSKGKEPLEVLWSTHCLQGTGMWTGYSSMEDLRALK